MEKYHLQNLFFIEQIYGQRECVGEEAKTDRLKNHAV